MLGRTIRQIGAAHPQLFILGLHGAQTLRLAPPGDEAVPAGAILAVMGTPDDIRAFVALGADPRVFALTVALATSNSFLIPTHQVNALIMGPAGYRVRDFMRAGSVMTLLFLTVMLVMLSLVFD